MHLGKQRIFLNVSKWGADICKSDQKRKNPLLPNATGQEEGKLLQQRAAMAWRLTLHVLHVLRKSLKGHRHRSVGSPDQSDLDMTPPGHFSVQLTVENLR